MSRHARHAGNQFDQGARKITPLSFRATPTSDFSGVRANAQGSPQTPPAQVLMSRSSVPHADAAREIPPPPTINSPLGYPSSRPSNMRTRFDNHQAGNEDALLRRHRPRTRSKPTKSRVCRDKEAVREEKEKALHGSIAETLQYGQRRAWHYG